MCAALIDDHDDVDACDAHNMMLGVTVPCRNGGGRADEGHSEVVNPRKDTRLENTLECKNSAKTKDKKRESPPSLFGIEKTSKTERNMQSCNANL